MKHLQKTCSENLDFQSYLDQRLTLPERIRLERHLKECSRCASECESFRNAFDQLELFVAPEPEDAPSPERIGRMIQTLKTPVKEPLKNASKEAEPEFWTLPLKWAFAFGITVLLVAFLGIRKPVTTQNHPLPEGNPSFSCLFQVQGEGNGVVCIDQPGSNAARTGTISSGNTYKVEGKARALLAYQSDSRIDCFENALFQADHSGFKLLSGKAGFEIHPRTQNFVVTTPSGTITCLGTRFVVEVNARSTLVTLNIGKIELSAGTNKTIVSSPGSTFQMAGGKFNKVETTAPNLRPGFPGVTSNPPVSEPVVEPGSSASSLQTSY